jgi:hypothetical protein
MWAWKEYGSAALLFYFPLEPGNKSYSSQSEMTSPEYVAMRITFALPQCSNGILKSVLSTARSRIPVPCRLLLLGALS